ncbi:uncharacterized protein CTRU02_206358 [Colletotrichum truncatum]|uniref:Uncharacterized protein n=1 Tax=Colletotrichum truncatum TaxID=5467 RepID=A0ACC3Z6L0_COLTU
MPLGCLQTHEDQATGPYEQPGLEVTPQEQLEHSEEWSRLQVASSPSEYYQNNGKEVVSGYCTNDKITVVTDYAELPQNERAVSPTKRRKPIRYIVGVTLFILVVIGAALGGLIASRKKTHDNSDEEKPASTPTSTPSTNTTQKQQSIRQGSPLTVTGWRKHDGVEIYLYYQDYNNEIRGYIYDGTRYWGNSWHKLDKYNSFASEGTRLAGTIIHWGQGYLPQIELFYTSDKNRLLGVSINEKLITSYEENNIKNIAFATGVNSSISAYWPWITFQKPSGELVEVRNRLGAKLSPEKNWNWIDLGIQAANASRLALVPLSTNFSKIADAGGYGIIYQSTDGRLATTVPRLELAIAGEYASSWPTTITLPEHAVFAAFSVARPSDPLQRVNTYVLYLDASFNINVVYVESGSWKTVQPSDLKNVDSDTDISCLTMATTYRDPDFGEVLLEEASKETRCYFQRGGQLMEVAFDGVTWTKVGHVTVT